MMRHRWPRSPGCARRQPAASTGAPPTAAERPQARYRPVEEAKVWTAIV